MLLCCCVAAVGALEARLLLSLSDRVHCYEDHVEICTPGSTGEHISGMLGLSQGCIVMREHAYIVRCGKACGRLKR